MSWLKKLWIKIRSINRWWLVLPLLGAGILAAVRLMRRSAPTSASRIPAMTEEEAQEELEQIDENLQASEEEIDEKYDRLEEKARKRWEDL